MAASNYVDVVDQLHAAGLTGRGLDDGLVTGRLMRVSIEGDRERRGWYMLHELQTSSGDLLLVGSYGIWHGNDNGAMKIELAKSAISADQRASLRKRLAEDRKRAERARKAEADRAAQAASAAWAKCEPTGDIDYLAKKGVGAHGVRFSPSGAMVLPMLDTSGLIHGLQIIRGANREKNHLAKEYWPRGLSKRGHFHLIGMPQTVLLIAEGYATAASLHEATGLPVAVAYDAGNLAPVAAALHKRYKQVRILLCADDDTFGKCIQCQARVDLATDPSNCTACGEPHQRINTGVTQASAAAMEVDGAWLRPSFTDVDKRRDDFISHGRKITDFNDLHATEGLHVVRNQVEARLSELGWSTAPRTRPTSPRGAGKDALRPIDSLSELLDRYALVYGKQGTLFDRQEHMLVNLTDVQHACINRGIHKAWMEHPERAIVRPREVGFDPACKDAEVTCNLWAGWPTEPVAGSCDKLLELLGYMCREEPGHELYTWVLRWIAYPIQHPGAKLKSCLVVHGPQGTGKNLFFEALMEIYGEYGRIVDQDAIEDKYNDWASRKLFLIADEVVARAEIWHVKNKLKGLITGEWIRINPKHVTSYDERNHVNIAFLSNEPMPVVLEEDDRRHCVIWTPSKERKDYYADVRAEIANGGIAALHQYLLNLDLGDFHPGTEPPVTEAKRELISLALDSPQRFYDDIIEGEIGNLGAEGIYVGLATDWYELYRLWCNRNGSKPAPQPKFINALVRKRGALSMRKRYQTLTGSVTPNPKAILSLARQSAPEGTSETAWMGERVEALHAAIADYRGSA